MTTRNDRVREFAAGRKRTCTARWTARAGSAGAAPGVEQPHRRTARSRSRKVALPLARGRPDVLEAACRQRAVSFRCRIEERPVSEDRPANAAAIQPIVRISNAGAFLGAAIALAEEIQTLAPHRTRLIEAAAVVLVGAGFRAHIEHAATGTAHLGVVGMDLDFHLRDSLDRRVGNGTTAQLGDRDTFEEIVVRADATASQRYSRCIGLILLAIELRIANGIHRGHGDTNQERVTPRRRQASRAAGGPGRHRWKPLPCRSAATDR